MKLPLSVLILAKNEERNIADCIRSALFAEEIIVIDDMSNDRTVEMAESLGAKVVQHSLDGNWGAQQTFAIRQASHDWIYFLDADERISEKLGRKIQELVLKDDRRYAYCNARLSYFWNQPLRHGGWFPDYVVRLLPARGTYVTGFVHPQFHHDYEEVRLPREEYLIHYPYRDWNHYFNKLNFYTTLAAEKSKAEGKSANLFSMISHPFWASFRMYVLKGGWKDGRIGFVLAAFHFFYTMAKYVKLYYLDKRNDHVGDEESCKNS
ncbi:MAG: glycosyltransferase family 2 protein [Selenomonadaceae bacterium]|nr:glycosyltransferase family 2 protein [Selenomonadaceae bacterium]